MGMCVVGDICGGGYVWSLYVSVSAFMIRLGGSCAPSMLSLLCC